MVIAARMRDPMLTGKTIAGWPRRPGRLGLGRVDAHHERVDSPSRALARKTFVNRGARGVSTRYLPLYLG